MKIDWATSPEPVVSGDRDVAPRCRANSKPFQILLYATIWGRRCIRLEAA